MRGNVIDNVAFDHKAFQKAQAFFSCIHGAITLEEIPERTVYLKDAPLAPHEIVRKLPELRKDELTIEEKRTSKGVRTYTISKTQKRWVFRLNLRGQEAFGAVSGTERRQMPLNSAVPTVVFTMRSVDAMVYYLGELVRLQIGGAPPPLVTVARDRSLLFKVDVDAGPGLGDRIEVEFLRQRFAVGRDGGRAERERDRSLTVLSLLSQLFSLYRESTELPRTTAVQVLGAP
jgi:hypothetical protein